VWSVAARLGANVRTTERISTAQQTTPARSQCSGLIRKLNRAV
jgi:hypothetical protein